MKGIVSALASNADGILAAGTFTRWMGLYDANRGGETYAVFPLDTDDKQNGERAVRGTGITQLLWSICSRYLCVVERNSDGVGVWDIRGSGGRMAWLKGRKGLTPQRLGAEVVGREVWAGGTDGEIRVWENLGASEGVVEPSWGFRAHDGISTVLIRNSHESVCTDCNLLDAVCATTFHYSGTVLATASGQQHPGIGRPFTEQSDGEEGEANSSSDESTLGGKHSSNGKTLSNRKTPSRESSSLHTFEDWDSSLRLWNL